MFRKHPKELLPVVLVNMFARFAFFTLFSVLVLFLSGKSGLTFEKTSIIYSIFYAAIFILTFVGGFIADRTRDYKGTVLMQSLCLLATVIGNSLLFLGAIMYKRIPILSVWLIFASICLTSMIVLLLMLKRIENYIITGNTTDFIISTYKHTQIVTPREYWMIYQP